MNRNTILAVGVALLVGLWSGLVLGQVTTGAAPSLPFVNTSDAPGPRSANAPRAGLRSSAGMAFLRLRLDSAGAAPKACLEFSQPLSPSGVDYADFLRLEPAAPFTTEVAGELLCIAGLPFEPDREVTILEGLPSQDGAATGAAETFTLSFGERPAYVGFAGNGVILPRAEADGVGIETVNVSRIAVEVLRVNDRILSQQAVEAGETIAEGSWDFWSFRSAGADVGERVYQGEIDIPVDNRRNETLTTVFPIGAALGRLQPGAYIVKAQDASPGAESGEDDYGANAASAYRWIIVTDLALQTFQGADGLDVVARSLQSARPLRGVTLTLIAENNAELGRVRTDGRGHARFAKALLDGERGQRPRMVMGYSREGDFAVLDLGRPALDLSDRDVGGRRLEGELDAYLYTERGVYRPGETVRLIGLLRDLAGRAVTTRPSTLVVYRPNGTEAVRQRLRPAVQAGAIARNVPLARGAPRGVWRAELIVDGVETPAGRVQFTVEDFVPQRLRVDLDAPAGPLLAGESRAISIDAQFLYGAPGAGLPVDAEARLQVDPNPFPDAQGFVFGEAGEVFEERFLSLASTMTDAQGRAEIRLDADDAPETSLPLRARLVASVSDPGGRAVRESLFVPVRLSNVYLGVKPAFENDRVAENSDVGFELIAVGAAGERQALNAVSWVLVEEDWSYDWYLQDGEWRWRRTGRDIPVTAGGTAVSADTPSRIAPPRLAGGSYRLDVRHEPTGARTSYRFWAGWGGGDSGDTPDTITVVGPVEPSRPGRAVEVRLAAPYAGRAQVVIATDRVLEMRTLDVPQGGSTLQLTPQATWGGGAYVLVTLMTGRDPANLPMPRRAVGVGYVPVDTGERRLTVAIGEGLGVVRPRQQILAPVVVTGAPRGEQVRVAIAAVDEGILALTKYETPDPADFFFGKRALGVEIRDDYGRLLNPNLGAPALARSGGDGLGGEGLTTVPQRTVALVSDVVEVGRGGRIDIPLRLPDFNGELRLMAVAWSESAVGASAQPLTVRDPVVAELSLPRFLAPGDVAQAALTLDNVEGPAGAYRVRLSGVGPTSAFNGDLAYTLAQGQQTRAFTPLSADRIGVGSVALRLEGPAGFAPIERSFTIETRTPYLPLTLATTAPQGPGQSYRLPADALSQFVPGDAEALVSYSNLRGIDPAPLAASLYRYPYGCSEQLVSVAMPLLYLNRVASDVGGGAEANVRRRVQDAVTALLDRQSSEGAFGLWRANDRGARPWIGAYVVDFLQRARAEGLVVPQAALDLAYEGLEKVARFDDRSRDVGYDEDVYAWPGNTDTTALVRSRAAAYAMYVLARAGRGQINDLRYMADARMGREPSPLARAHIAAALHHMGDEARAAAAFREAERALGYRNVGDWYQTPVRDIAAVLALAVEANQTELVDRLATRLEREAPDPDGMSTQEKAQVLRAAHALLSRGAVDVSLNGSAGAGARLRADAARIAQGLTFRNDGAAQIWRTVTLIGSPLTAPPAAAAGFALSKAIYGFDGGAVDLGAVRQGDRLVIVVSGEPQSVRTHPALVVDMLPAGFEIETVLGPQDGLGPERWDGTRRSGPFAFAGELQSGRVAEARDDRFVAALDVTGTPFRFAYIVRAVTPGVFALPGAHVEDMYRPAIFGRTATREVRIVPRDG